MFCWCGLLRAEIYYQSLEWKHKSQIGPSQQENAGKHIPGAEVVRPYRAGHQHQSLESNH